MATVGDGYTDLVRAATGGNDPYPYQTALALDGLPDVLRAPTGSGKTEAAVLGWLFRRLHHPEMAVRAGTPHWLVFVLPQRTLVEQTVGKVRYWLDNLRDVGLVGSPVPEVSVHVLMGGEDQDHQDWMSAPDRVRIFVGTQDMILSRLLNRGFAEGRSRWPMSFGLLNSGVQFVFDEIQLMGPGLGTSLQLDQFRAEWGTALPSRSMWMSATLDPLKLTTVDFTRALDTPEFDSVAAGEALARRLLATRTIERAELGEPTATKYPTALAQAVLEAHRPATRTLVVANTVDRAVRTYQALQRSRPEADLVLLHSRFRPEDRQRHTDDALAEVGVHGTIVLSTQVLEAGVDLTSETMFTELAPWSSIVQRAGRCNRDGAATNARLFWTSPPQPLPYESDDLVSAGEALIALEGAAVTGTELGERAVRQVESVHALPRRRDLVNLFDTASDLSGNDIDVSPFIRDADERTVFVVWRDIPAEVRAGRAVMPQVQREELCPTPIADVRAKVGELATSRDRAVVYDQAAGRWRPAGRADVRPTTPVVLPASAGGYRPEIGFDRSAMGRVEPVAVVGRREDRDGLPDDARSEGRAWQPLTDHLAETEAAASHLIAGLAPDLDDSILEAIVVAARYHDIGKAHRTFKESLRRANDDAPPDAAMVWAKSPSSGRALRHYPPYFRHELVSALLLLGPWASLLDGLTEVDLTVFLVLAHHGKVRLAVRAQDDESADTVLGVREGSEVDGAELPGGQRMEPVRVSLEAVRLQPGSLTERALRLRDRPDLGPFRLAFCEALVRAADWRVSGAATAPELLAVEPPGETDGNGNATEPPDPPGPDARILPDEEDNRA